MPVMVIAIILTAAIMSVNAFASVGYTANPRLPDNQRPGVTGYFDLVMQPGQRQELAILVTNSSDRDMTISVEAYAASTGRGGHITYIPPGSLIHTPRFMIPDLVEFPQSEVVVSANSALDVIFFLTMPDEAFVGSILGGINVVNELTEADLPDADGVIHQFAYIVAIQMRQTETPAAPEFYLQGVEAGVVHHRATMAANIVNPQMRLIRDAKVSAWIYPENSGEPILEFFSDTVRMAPDSMMQLTMSEELGAGVVSGNYIARVNIQYDGGLWDFEEAFFITPEEASRINEVTTPFGQPLDEPSFDDPSLSDSVPLWAMIAIGIGALLLIAVIALIIALTRKKMKPASI